MGIVKITPDFQCPNCGPVVADTTDSRPGSFGGLSVRKRKRKCKSCGDRFTTVEATMDWISEFTDKPQKMDVVLDVIADLGITKGQLLDRLIAEATS